METKCMFCDNEKCKGHDISTPTDNRFMKDEKFVIGAQFEFESTEQPTPKFG